MNIPIVILLAGAPYLQKSMTATALAISYELERAAKSSASTMPTTAIRNDGYGLRLISSTKQSLTVPADKEAETKTGRNTPPFVPLHLSIP